METILCLSLLLNVILLTEVFLRGKGAKTPSVVKKEPTVGTKQEAKAQPEAPCIVNAKLHNLAKDCEAKLPKKYQGLIKILVEKDEPELPATLEVGRLSISLKKDGQNLSMIQVYSTWEAISMACYGHNGTGRYIPVPSELDYIMVHKDIINIYLQALGLELISEKNKYLVVDVPVGPETGWKSFNWSIEEAYKRLRDKFKLWKKDGYGLVPSVRAYDCDVKLILLRKSWDYKFVEA